MLSMSELPTGVVTFLLTDIDGSALLWEHEAAAMTTALERYDALIGHSVAAHAGVLCSQGSGESRLAVFARATDGVATAAALQTAFTAETSTTSTPPHVRMALHTG